MFIPLVIFLGSLLVGQYQFQEIIELNDPPNLFDPVYQSSLALPYIESFNNFDFDKGRKINTIWGIEHFGNRHGINYWFERFNENTVLALKVFPKDVVAMANCASIDNCPDLDTLACC